ISAVKAARPTMKYVVFAGGDDQIPFFRMPDLSLIANENGFADQFGPNEYYGALASGDLLTDNPYLDTRPVPAGGRQLFIPDLDGGRLVETPSEVSGDISRFESSGGILKSSTAFVSGYDFVTDGSQLVQSRLGGILGSANVRSLYGGWTGNQLLGAAFPTGGAAAINDWNGHYDNYRALAGNGTDLISTSMLTGAHALSGGIFFTMGCHAGFQTTDAIVGATAPSALDWAQYFSRAGTGFVGNTGFGLGNTDSVAFSEELMADFAGHLNSKVSIVDALVQAKRDYYLSRDAFSSYDEKTLSEAELYGLPMYGVGVAPTPLQPTGVTTSVTPPASPDPVLGSSSSKSPSQGGLSQFGTTSAQTSTFDVVPNFTGPTTGAHGSYYTNAGQVQAPNYRPLQPYVTMPTTRSGGLTAHGVIIDALTSGDHSGFNPDNVRPTLDLSANEPEPQFADEAWPTKVPTLVSLNDANGLSQQLNLTTGQFFDDTTSHQGVERLWTHIGGRVVYSTSQDFTPPTIDDIDAYTNGSSVTFTGHFSDLDQNGNPGTVALVQVVYDLNNTGTWVPLQLTLDPSSGMWSAGAPFTGTNVQYFVEACDIAGNCGYSSNKGRYFDAQPLPPQQGTITVTPNGSGWQTTPGGVAVDATSSTGATVTVSVDGAAPVAPPVTVSGDGAHVVNASASDGATATAVILVDTTPPALTLPSHIYVGDSVPLSTICTDSGSGIKTCSGTQNGATLDSTHSLNTAHAGPINLVLHATDNAGNTAQLATTVAVEKATPAVNWPQPAPIVFGTKLGSAQLDATSPVPGKFVYTPAAGTVLQPGQQTLSVTFTPTSTAD